MTGYVGGRMAQPNKKLPSILIIQSIPLKGRSTTGRVSSSNCPATSQLKSQKQKHYPQKEFHFIHSNYRLSHSFRRRSHGST